MEELLFQEFEEVSAKQWKQKIQYDLKGADYNEKLITHTLHEIDIKPFYTQEDVTEKLQIKNPSNWNICEKVFVTSESEAAKKAISKFSKGGEAIWFQIPNTEIDLKKLFENLPEGKLYYLECNFLDAAYLKSFNIFLREKNFRIHVLLDIVGNLARSGNFFYNLKDDHSELEKIVRDLDSFETVIGINTAFYHNAGATIPQQLAYAMCHFSEYANHFPEEKDLKFTYKLATGSDYFMEIAKIRALRWLHRSLAQEFQLNETCHVLAESAKRNKTLYDYNVNLLRTTTESMSAILGGADSICNSPYDAIYHKDNEFGDRIARNQLLVMRHEGYFGKVGNAAAGSYYIESLTKQLAEKALEIFKDIESGGGMLKQLNDGAIQKKIKESAKQQQKKFDEGELVLIGTNKYENAQDRMKDDLELYPFLKKKPRKTLIEPVLERRLSEAYEKERLAAEEESIKTENNE